MKKLILYLLFALGCIYVQAQKTPPKAKVRYDTIIVKHKDKPAVKQVKQVEKVEIIIPTPEYINQPYYYDKDGNKLIKLENATAQMITKKKTLGLKGAKQFLSMTDPSSKIRFTARNSVTFIIKTSGDVIDLTSYIKLYKFIAADQKREVTISAKEGVLNDKEDQKGKLINISVKQIAKDNYMIQFAEALEAGEYGFVWVKNMEQKEFSVSAFGIDWKNSD